MKRGIPGMRWWSLAGARFEDARLVSAYRCTQCARLEFYAETDPAS